MASHLRPAVASLLFMTLITGAAYPLLVTAIGQGAFPDQANGSLIRDIDGQVRGSHLIAQSFEGDGWFHSRPSAGDYATVASGASNLAPTNPALTERIQTESERWEATRSRPVPMALVTTSGSGLDPDLPPDAVRYQIPRIAAARGLDQQRLEALVDRYIRPSLIGPETVNVLELNRALDAIGTRPTQP
ncbi:potassium-transporting ATPase subunit KdpC [Pseudomonas sp. Marseille-QA0892]